MEILFIFAAVTPLEWILGIVATVASAFLIGAGKLMWDLTGEVRELRLIVQTLVKDVDKVKRLVEQGRKWRWDKTPLPEPDDDT